MDAAALAASVLNRANQLNPSHFAYWSSRGMEMPGAAATVGAAASSLPVIGTVVGAIGAIPGIAFVPVALQVYAGASVAYSVYRFFRP